MRVLVVGGSGMLGHKLCQVLSKDYETFATFRGDVPDVPDVYARTKAIRGIDIQDLESVTRAISVARPDAVINASGLIKHRAAAQNPVASITANSLFPHQLERLCSTSGSRLIHFSTDCVFSGIRGRYTEEDNPDPVDLYGRSKLLGEIARPPSLTLRTSIIGRELSWHSGLLDWFLSHAGGRIPGYTAAIYSGLTTASVAMVVARTLTIGELSGVWHVSSEAIDKYSLLRNLNEVFETHTEIIPDGSFACDRSLTSDRFWKMTGLDQPRWADMLLELGRDRTRYKHITGAAL